ncbi:hypothetical protein CVS40_8784 [Lucilia cuprina]|nr:hypothetical protein CVS40_8784 [Lucilia cuprina]
MASNKPFTRSQAKSLENMGKTASVNQRSDRVVSEPDLNETVRHIDENLLKDDDGSVKISNNLSMDNIRELVYDVVQNQVVDLMSNLEQNLLIRLNETISQLCIQKNRNQENSRQRINNGIDIENFEERRLSSSNRPLEMHRWNIYFSGDDKELRVDDFIRRVEHIACSQGISLQEVANNLYILLKGQAANWYFQWVQRNRNITWNSLKSALEVQFRSCESDYDLEHKMMNRLQKYNESFDQFYNVILDLNSRMSCPRSDRDLIEIMKRNIASKMLIFVHNSTSNTLPEFLLECRRAERNVLKIETGFNRTLFKPKVNEVEFVDEVSSDCGGNEEFIEALSRGKPSKDISDITCFD